MPLPSPIHGALSHPAPPDLRTLARRAHTDHLPHRIRLRDGETLIGIVTAVVGGDASEMRVKVVLASGARERRWLHLRDIKSIG